MKYDYTGASKLFAEYKSHFFDPWDLSDSEWQVNRRDFMRAFTRHDDSRLEYIEYAREWLDNCLVDECIDSTLTRECEQIIERLMDF